MDDNKLGLEAAALTEYFERQQIPPKDAIGVMLETIDAISIVCPDLQSSIIRQLEKQLFKVRRLRSATH